MEDIQVIHELDEAKNQRVIIFRGEESPQNKLDIITSADKEESYYHCSYFKKYLETEYLDDAELQRIRPNIKLADGLVTTSIIYYLSKVYNDITFTETTADYTKERYGVFYLPDEISLEQYQEIEKLQDYFKQFTSILIQGDLNTDNYIVDANLSKAVVGSEISVLLSELKTLIKKDKHI